MGVKLVLSSTPAGCFCCAQEEAWNPFAFLLQAKWRAEAAA